MPVYPDKRAGGQLTGRWRVELQSQGKRYRQRWDTHAEAVEDEKRVKALWAAGEDVVEAVARVEARKPVPTIEWVSGMAQGQLWANVSSGEEQTSWAHVRAIAHILGGGTVLDDISTTSIDRVIRELADRGKADGTINRYLSHFHRFLGWAKARGYRTKELSEITFEWRDEDEGRIRWITEAEETRLYELLPPHVAKLVWVAIETGCRRSELLSAKADQINGDRLHIWKTKTNDPRTVPMEPEVREALASLIATGTMPTVRELRTEWDKARKIMGLAEDPEFVFHACRHTCATRLVDARVHLLVIQRFLGHKRIETTQRYAHVRPETLEDALALRKAHRSRLIQIQKRGKGDLPHAGGVGCERRSAACAD